VKVRKSKLGQAKPDDSDKADIMKIIENSEQKEDLVNEVTEAIY
jgi:phenylpyruvate tautomerase PptA (4-oxalocrotonate tautomerase family)